MIKINQPESLRMRRHDGTYADANPWLPQVAVRRESGWGRKEP